LALLLLPRFASEAVLDHAVRFRVRQHHVFESIVLEVKASNPSTRRLQLVTVLKPTKHGRLLMDIAFWDVLVSKGESQDKE
jgi:hypothetical protein